MVSSVDPSSQALKVALPRRCCGYMVAPVHWWQALVRDIARIALNGVVNRASLPACPQCPECACPTVSLSCPSPWGSVELSIGFAVNFFLLGVLVGVLLVGCVSNCRAAPPSWRSGGKGGVWGFARAGEAR